MRLFFVILLFIFTAQLTQAATPLKQTQVTVCSAHDQTNITLIKAMYKNLNIYDNTQDPATLKKVLNFFSPNVTYVMNKVKIASNVKELVQAFKNIGAKTHVSPITYKSILSVKGKVVALYTTTIVLNSNVFPLDIVAIFTIKNGKIVRWDEVIDQTDTFL